MIIDDNMPLFDKITIIGLGLIGGSLLEAVVKNKPRLCSEISGVDSDEETVKYFRGKYAGIVEITSDDKITNAVKNADVIIMAVPIENIEEPLLNIKEAIKDDSIITDVSSVKRQFFKRSKEILANEKIHIIPAHPIVGNEKSGYKNSDATIFQKKICVLTPEIDEIDEIKIKELQEFWQILGCKTKILTADMHDMIYAYVSHLPQLLAFCYHDVMGIKGDVLQNIAMTKDTREIYRRFSRLQNSPKNLWDGIFSVNRDYLLEAVTDYLDILSKFSKHLEEEMQDAATEIYADEPYQDTNYTNDTYNESIIFDNVLFIRIITSCMISLIDHFEKKHQVKLADFAGGGLHDFTAPAVCSPLGDIAFITRDIPLIKDLNKRFIEHLHGKINSWQCH